MSLAGKLLSVAGCTIALASCGGGGGGGANSSSSISPTQYANSQRDVGYLRAVNQITAAFNKPPANPTDYKTGRRELQAAIHGLSLLSVPPAFAAPQVHLLAALHADEALLPGFERAARTNDRVAQNNLEAQNIRDQTAMNASFREMVKTYDKCRTSKFGAC